MGLDEGPGPGLRFLPFSNRPSHLLLLSLPLNPSALLLFLSPNPSNLSTQSFQAPHFSIASQPKRIVSKSTIIQNWNDKTHQSQKSRTHRDFHEIQSTESVFSWNKNTKSAITNTSSNERGNKVQDLIFRKRQLGFLKIYTRRDERERRRRLTTSFHLFLLLLHLLR